MLAKKGLSAAPSAVAQYVEDVFSTYLYSGQSSGTITIDNGIDLSGEGGFVWIKTRSGISGHQLFDTERGITNRLQTNTTGAQSSQPFLGSVTSTGFTLPAAYQDVSGDDIIYTSWTFRKAKKFFDVVTWTGNGVNPRNISHNLGSTPGCIIVKCTSTSTNWCVWHRSVPNDGGYLNTTAAFSGALKYFGSTVTSTQFSLNSQGSEVNGTNQTYVAYLFAHDAGGFGDAGDQSVIKCGSYTGNGSTTGPSVTLDWEPQWIMIKRASGGTGNWMMFDNMRGMSVGGSGVYDDYFFYANTSAAESYNDYIIPNATGFSICNTTGDLNTNGDTYIYIAIRRGPMKTPTDATKVFTPTVYTGTNDDNRLINTTIAPDFVMIRQRNDTVVPGMYTGSRLTGQEFLITGSTNAGSTDADSFDAQIVSSVEYGNAFSSMNGVWVGNDATRKFNADTTSNNHIIEAFKRAPGFFDVVCYTGTGSATTISHNLGVAPELMIVKRRDASASWAIYHSSVGNTKILEFTTAVPDASTAYWNDTSPTSSNFSLGGATQTNGSGATFVAYLFSSVTGVSKVGSYTGNGSSVTVTTGFQPRFILVKRTDSTGNWIVGDSARGLPTGNDPALFLNSTAAETTGQDWVDVSSTGFTVNETALNANVNTGTYIYLAIS